MSLEELVKSAQQGDDDAFYTLVSADKQRLYQIAYAYLKNEADALEAVQEATCRAYIKLKQTEAASIFSHLADSDFDLLLHRRTKKKEKGTSAPALARKIGG